MKNNLQMLNVTLTSLEVAEMVEKRHRDLVRESKSTVNILRSPIMN